MRQQAGRSAMQWFERYLNVGEGERDALLAALAEDDRETHAALLRLIAADAEAEAAHFLAAPALAQLPHGEPAAEVPDLSGAQIGAWRLLRLIGVGGAGQVWLAQRADGRHEGQAAVKLLRATDVAVAAQQRFAREGRLLARLDHPHIAHLLDVGEHAPGQRFLVLEHVDGERIDHFCDRGHASVETRLGLFLQICDAVAYAHSRLIVHRDLKPSNILVQPDGVAKLLDFGVAKLLERDDDGDELTELTRAGAAPFTPEYAAPEQFEHQPITVATDVYSLGAVLYLLLTGRRPYGNDAVTPAQLARAVVGGAPRRLAHALGESTRDTGELARRRSTTPQQLKRQLRGDLDTIVHKALKRAPEERYASAQALGEDVRRYLAKQPIAARADSSWYRARMLVARHRVVAALVAALALVLVTASAVLLVQARRLAAEVERANTIKDFLLGAFRHADAYAANGEPATDVATMIERAAADIDGMLGVDAETRAEMYASFGALFFRIGRYERARESYAKAIALYRPLEGERSPRLWSLEAAAIDNEQIHGNVDGLLPRIDELLAALGDGDAPLPRLRTRWQLMNAKVVVALAVGEIALARATAERYVGEVARRLGRDNYEFTYAEWRLARVLLEAGATEEADRRLRDEIALDRKVVPSTHPGLLTDVMSAVDVLVEYGAERQADAIANAVLETRRRLFGPSHWVVSDTYARTAVIAGELGDDARASADFAAAFAIARKVLAPHARELAVLHYQLGLFLLRRARLDEARRQLTDCVRVFELAQGRWHWQRAACAAAVAYVDARAGGASAAELDRLIAEERAHGGRELAAALWLRARLASEKSAPSANAQALGWLDEAAALLRASARDGSRLGRDVEAARVALGAPPAAPPPSRGAELIAASKAILAAAHSATR